MNANEARQLSFKNSRAVRDDPIIDYVMAKIQKACDCGERYVVDPLEGYTSSGDFDAERFRAVNYLESHGYKFGSAQILAGSKMSFKPKIQW